MNKLLIESGKFASSCFSDDSHSMLWYHTKMVQKISLAIMDRYFKRESLNRDAIIMGTYFHDIGIPTKKEGHAKISKDMAAKFFEDNGVKDNDLKEVVYDIILNHGSNGKPKTKEGLIVCSADKISLLDEATVMHMLCDLQKNQDLYDASNALRNKIEKKYLSVPLMEAKKFANRRYKKVISILTFLK